MAVAVQYMTACFRLSETFLPHRQPPPLSSAASHSNASAGHAGKSLGIASLQIGLVQHQGTLCQCPTELSICLNSAPSYDKL